MTKSLLNRRRLTGKLHSFMSSVKGSGSPS